MLSHKLKRPSKSYFQTLVFLTMKNILQFTNTNIPDPPFSDEIFSAVA